MEYFKVILLPAFLFITGTIGAQENDIDKGFRLSSDAVTKNFTLMRLAPEEAELVKYIIKTNYKIAREDAKEISKNIIKISNCFPIDPWILTSLIQKESSFKKDAVSPTNAAGLTQFTSSGLKEVHDQFGRRGRGAATESAITYFNAQTLGCVDPNWIDLWVKVGVPEEDFEFYNLSKEEIKKDTQLAITYGAILLKTYVAYIDNKINKSEASPSLSETYFQALQMYNGEEGDAKVRYAKSIFLNLKALYPTPVNFPFLN